MLYSIYVFYKNNSLYLVLINKCWYFQKFRSWFKLYFEIGNSLIQIFWLLKMTGKVKYFVKYQPRHLYNKGSVIYVISELTHYHWSHSQSHWHIATLQLLFHSINWSNYKHHLQDLWLIARYRLKYYSVWKMKQDFWPLYQDIN